MSTVHFIGIGGIGTSALAKYYLMRGDKVTGSDLAPSLVVEDLRDMGASIVIGPHTSHILRGQKPKPDLVVFSPAVEADNKELKEAKRRKIPALSYPEALGELTKVHTTVAVSGTHGKSTITAMIGLLLTHAGLDPTVIVGTRVKEFASRGHTGSNCRVGKGSHLVIEADEYAASLLNYSPDIAVLTNIEEDHLDFYKNLKTILTTFRKYLDRLKEDGIVVANRDDKNIKEVVKGKSAKITWYGTGKKKDLAHLKKILKVPGKHNLLNALAALSAARELGIPDKKSFASLAKFKGTWRRFETFPASLGAKKVTIVSDYAHHPTEVDATLQAVREKFGKKRVHVVFQPHQYRRTYLLFKDFVRVLSRAPVHSLLIPDIYNVAGRESGEILKKVSSQKLVEAIQKRSQNKEIYYLPKEKVLSHLQEKVKRGDVVVIMGAGDIFTLAESLKDT